MQSNKALLNKLTDNDVKNKLISDAAFRHSFSYEEEYQQYKHREVH